MKIDVIDLPVVQRYVAVAVSDNFARRITMEKERDAYQRTVIHYLIYDVASQKIHEEERTVYRSLTWIQRLAALFGKPLPMTVAISMHHNCPHIAADPLERHVGWTLPRMETS